MEVEEAEMREFLERGIVEPSLSLCGKSKVMVQKKNLPDGTSGGLRVTADKKAVKSATDGDDFPTEDIGMILDWFAKERWFTVADVKDGYWNVRLAEGNVPEGRQDRSGPGSVHLDDNGFEECVRFLPEVGEQRFCWVYGEMEAGLPR
jgi:hypothetical protein